MNKFYMPQGLKRFFEARIGEGLPKGDQQQIIGILNKSLARKQRENNRRVLQEHLANPEVSAEIVVI